jgi:UDP-2,3-diacylglucosamine pyrophosphatase LpxH
LSDLHLAHEGSDATASAVARLLANHPGQEVVLAGDVFGLSSDPPDRDPVESVCRLFGAYPEFSAALRTHVSHGGPLHLMAGNHDAALTRPGMRSAILAQFELSEAAPLTIVPWFLRRESVHIEHGHLWDPDNAPVHPLAPWSSETEPLGVALTRQFVAPYRAWQFAHAHETTLLEGLSRAYRIFGKRMPWLVFHYFLAAGQICTRTLNNQDLERALSQGRLAMGQEAEHWELPPAVLEHLVHAAPTPTHTEFRRTFLRLYFDRVSAALGLGFGAAWALTALSPVGLALALGSGSYLSLNVRRTGKRYQNRPIQFLREGAEVVRSITSAKLVVFGHTHVAENGAAYANAGSFGYPQPGRGRPYLVVDPKGSAEARSI